MRVGIKAMFCGNDLVIISAIKQRLSKLYDFIYKKIIKIDQGFYFMKLFWYLSLLELVNVKDKNVKIIPIQKIKSE